MSLSNNIYIDAFKKYIVMGLDPLPIPYEDGHPTKGPKITDWPTKAANHEFTETDFEDASGVGIELGGKKNETDLDCDSPEAVRIGGEVMNALEQRRRTTQFKFGRPSKPRSHSVFVTDKSLPSEKVIDPADEQCIIEYRCLKENGERGLQTILPPSLNYDPKSGCIEEVRFEADSAAEPSFIEAETLRSIFKVIGATALLAKHFPAEGNRHKTILALAGVFARNEMAEQKAVEIVALAYRHSAGYNGDQKKAEADVRSVYKTHATDPATHLCGYPTLTEIMPKAVVDKVLELLGIDRPQTSYNLTDAGNGRRLVDKHGEDIRLCTDLRCWFV